MAETAKPVVEFTIEEDAVKMISKVSFFNQVITIKLDGEYQQSFEGTEMKVSLLKLQHLSPSKKSLKIPKG